MAKASITRNYRFPTLNDLYFLPGGNPALNNESGFTYETGLSFSVDKRVYQIEKYLICPLFYLVRSGKFSSSHILRIFLKFLIFRI